MVKKSLKEHHEYNNEMSLVKKLMERDWACMSEHTLREAKQSIDAITKMGLTSARPLVIFTQAPQELKATMEANALGIICSNDNFC